MRLWELEGGDGGDVDYGFAGGLPDRRNVPVADAARREEEAEMLDAMAAIPEIEEPEDERREEADRIGHPEDNQGRAEVARQGPLVLQLVVDRPAPRRDRAVLPEAPAPPLGRRAQHQQQQARDQNEGRGRRQQQRQQPRQQPGRGARPAPVGFGRGAGGDGAPAAEVHREGQNQLAHDNNGRRQGRGNGNAPRGGMGLQGRRAEVPDELGEADQEWVRNFVRAAVNDEEDLLESDSDGDEEEQVIFWRDDGR